VIDLSEINAPDCDHHYAAHIRGGEPLSVRICTLCGEIDWDDLRAQVQRPEVPDHLRGDGPCTDCGTLDNVVWFTESVFWNAVCRQGDYVEPMLCIPCFVKRVDKIGYYVNGWRLPYHGEDFKKLGFERGEPRCDSCKQPYRVVKALEAIDYAAVESGPA
jgi:hypothetical protein